MRDDLPTALAGILGDAVKGTNIDLSDTTGTDNADALVAVATRAIALKKPLNHNVLGKSLIKNAPEIPAGLRAISQKGCPFLYSKRGIKHNGDMEWQFFQAEGFVQSDDFCFFSVGKKDHVRLYYPSMKDGGLILTNGITYAEADWATFTNIPLDYEIWGPDMFASSSVVSGALTAMLAIHCKGFRVYGGSVRGSYSFGFMYWGGDSAIGADGAVGNPRKCDDILVEGLWTNAAQAGAWGSMGGSNIKFSQISAIRDTIGGDVGIDHEGTLCAVNENCFVKNYENGNYASFFAFGSVQNINCISEQHGGKPHYRQYNVTQNSHNSGEVVFIGGEFRRTPGTAGLCSVDDQGGCFKSFQMVGTKLRDAFIYFNANKLWALSFWMWTWLFQPHLCRQQ